MVSVHENFSQQLLHRWPHSFKPPRDRIDLHGEDESCVAALNSLNPSEDIIGSFMTNIPENYACPYKKQTVVRFCAGVTMETFEGATTNQKVSLLSDTNDNGGTAPLRGGLTAFDLYKALRRPVSEVSQCGVTLELC